LQEAKDRDMGVFIISPSDKGGKLYSPPDTLVEAVAPFSPMVFNDLFCLHQGHIDTLSIGASCPGDFDEHVKALKYMDDHDARSRVSAIAGDLTARLEAVCGKDFYENYYDSLPDWDEVPGHIHLRNVVWLWLLTKGLDLVEFGKMRYGVIGNVSDYFPGEKVDLERLPEIKETVLKGNPYADTIVEIINEVPELLKSDKA